jgi:hypothetical protein
MQPTPAKNPGGDCFACSLTAGMRHLFPDRPISFDDAWNLFVDAKSGQLSNTWHTMRQALYRAHGLGYETEITADIVDPRFDPEQWSHAWWSHFPELRYAHRLEGWLSAGWFAVTEIAYSGGGPMTPDGHHRGTDHFVLLDGVKYAETEYGGQYTSILPHVHVVCSNKGAYWIRVQDFIMKHGGAGWWLCRKDERQA